MKLSGESEEKLSLKILTISHSHDSLSSVICLTIQHKQIDRMSIFVGNGFEKSRLCILFLLETASKGKKPVDASERRRKYREYAQFFN